jgi:hypothetical protein
MSIHVERTKYKMTKTPNNTGDMGEVSPKVQALHVEDGSGPDINQEHCGYLLRRHGTLELNPIPSEDPADPLNWPSWKVRNIWQSLHKFSRYSWSCLQKHTSLLLVAFHSFMANFIGAGVIPAYDTFADLFSVSVQDASYYTSVVVCF